jgi:hypothetical protein
MPSDILVTSNITLTSERIWDDYQRPLFVRRNVTVRARPNSYTFLDFSYLKRRVDVVIPLGMDASGRLQSLDVASRTVLTLENLRLLNSKAPDAMDAAGIDLFGMDNMSVLMIRDCVVEQAVCLPLDLEVQQWSSSPEFKRPAAFAMLGLWIGTSPFQSVVAIKNTVCSKAGPCYVEFVSLVDAATVRIRWCGRAKGEGNLCSQILFSVHACLMQPDLLISQRRAPVYLHDAWDTVLCAYFEWCMGFLACWQPPCAWGSLHAGMPCGMLAPPHNYLNCARHQLCLAASMKPAMMPGCHLFARCMGHLFAWCMHTCTCWQLPHGMLAPTPAKLLLLLTDASFFCSHTSIDPGCRMYWSDRRPRSCRRDRLVHSLRHRMHLLP